MSDEIRHPDGRIEHPSVRHEPTDANLGWIAGLVVFTGVGGVVMCYLVLLLFRDCRDSLAEERKSRFPLATPYNARLPPEPRLEQLDRMAQLPGVNANFRQNLKLERLHSYGETSDPAFVHIPIDQAMVLLAGKLPARNQLHAVQVIDMTQTWGRLWMPQGALVALGGLSPDSNRLIQAFVEHRENGLVDGGAPNSGRLFNKRKPAWLAH